MSQGPVNGGAGALFSLNMPLATLRGRAYTEAEAEDKLTAAGVGDLRMLEFVGPTQSRILAGAVARSRE